mgnify:CR=1 FL=1
MLKPLLHLQEKYATVTNLFFRGAHAALIVYGIDDKVTLCGSFFRRRFTLSNSSA